MSNITIQEEFTLPSRGKIYGQQFDPTVKMRSMTVAEEMKRLSAVENQYKTMCEIIEDCLITKIPIPVYDLCLGDYQFLLHRLRVATYGPEYHLAVRCPVCGSIIDHVVNLDELPVFEYDEEFDDLMTFKLPTTQREIKLKYQTPRSLDTVNRKKKEFKQKFPDSDDQTLAFTLEMLIDTVDGSKMNGTQLMTFIKGLPLKDSTLILQKGDKLNSKVGIDTALTATCSKCQNSVPTTFRYTSEFFRPEID